MSRKSEEEIQLTESLAERTGWCGRMGDFEKDAT